MGSLLADTIIYHAKKDARRVARLVKAWDDPRVSAQLVVQDPNELHFDSGEWAIGVWGGMDEDDDKSFREMTRMIRCLAHAEPRGLLLLWNGTPVPELAEQLAVPAVAGTGDPEDDILVLRRAIQKASTPAPAVASVAAAPSAAPFTTNWASARAATGTVATAPAPAPITPPVRPIDDDELGVPFVKPAPTKRSNSLVLVGLGALVLIGGGALAAPYLMKAFAPRGEGSTAASIAPSAAAPEPVAPEPVAPASLASTAPADAPASGDLPKVERLSPPTEEAMLAEPPAAKPASVITEPPAKKPVAAPAPMVKAAPLKPEPKLAKPAPGKPAPALTLASKPTPTKPATITAPPPLTATVTASGPKTTLAATGATGAVKTDSDAVATAPKPAAKPAVKKPSPAPAPPKPAGPQGPDL